MKKGFICSLIIVMSALLYGCCLSHDWEAASCSVPQTCAKCGKTAGEALGHQWREATCTAPKTCTGCGITEGDKLAHTFGEEEVQNPDYVKATALFVKTCTDCGKQGKRRGELEKFTNLTTFMLTPEEFSERFTDMLKDLQDVFGKDQYEAYIDTEKDSGNLKMYMAKIDSKGKRKVVGEFEMEDPFGNPLRTEQSTEADVLCKVHGTVKGKDQSRLAMFALWRAAEPGNTLDKYLNYRKAMEALDIKVDTYSIPDSRYVYCKVTPKGSSSCEFSVKVQRSH